MKLRTLGGLSVEGVIFKREKVLLLLAYLCLEGPQPRKRLAEVFWPDASNPMNSLAQHLVHLRTIPGAVKEEGSRVEACLPCDAHALREAARKGQAGEAADLYRGQFLDGLTIPLGPDLEEWVFDTRESLALETRSALLTLAGQAAARGHTSEGSDLAARALTLSGAPPADELELPKLWHLLTLAGHPLAAQVEREARTLGLNLETINTSVPSAPFVGREKELARLGHLPSGNVAWITGHAGMGKTALLEALARTGGWTILPGRSGLPYGTLEPLTRTPPTSTHAALQALRDPKLKVAIDDWHGTDEATQAVITLAAKQRPGAAIVVTCRRHPTFDVDTALQLEPLTEIELAAHPDLHRQTDGHPTLIGAALRGQPLEIQQGPKVRALPSKIRDTYLLLSLQDNPDLRATRAAIDLTADEFAQALSQLTQEGLTLEGGRVYAAKAAREQLAQIPVHHKLLHLKLARTLTEQHAWPHYEAARDLWEEEDEHRAAKAARLRANDLLKRGYPGQAVELLDTFADRPDLAVDHAWALLGVGRYLDALRRVEALDETQRATPQALAARATALVRLGRDEEAIELASIVKGSGPEAARAASVQAHAARIREHWKEARKFGQIASDLWRINGDEEQRLTELGMVAIAKVREGMAPAQAFEDVLKMSGDFPSVMGTNLVNFAMLLIETGAWDRAEDLLDNAISELTIAGDILGVAQAHTNRGLQFHLKGSLKEAANDYRTAISMLKGTGSIRNLGLALSNLSEIEGDLSSFEDVLLMLVNAGQHELVAHIRQNSRIAAPLKSKPLRS